MNKSTISLLVLMGALSFTPAHSRDIFGSMIKGITANFTGDGEITKLEGGKYDIVYTGSMGDSRAEKYAEWGKLAKQACKGRKYVVIKREFITGSVTVSQILQGIIRCK